MTKPIIDKTEVPGGIQIRIQTRDEGQARKILNGLKRKHPQIDVAKSMSEAIHEDSYLDSKVRFDLKGFGGSTLFLAIAKIAVNFYLSSGGEPRHVFGPVASLKARTGAEKFCNFYYPDSDITENDFSRIIHGVVVRGDRNEGMLYAYVELFCFFKAIVVLNSSYNGDQIELSYFFDVKTRKELHLASKFGERRQRLVDCLSTENALHEHNINSMIKELEKFVAYAERSQIIEECVSKALRNREDKSMASFTPEMVDDVVAELMKKLVPSILKRRTK
jgi:hypothetical protein